MKPYTKVHYYAFLLDALARYEDEGSKVGTPLSWLPLLESRLGKNFKRHFISNVIGRMQSDPLQIKGGVIAEFGARKGRTISRMAKLLPGEMIYGFDSFSGFPADGRSDWKVDFAVKQPPRVPDNVELISGYFEDTLPAFRKRFNDGERLRFAHIDCDIYSSTVTIFNELSDMFATGTIILFDELLNYNRFIENEFLAFYEFLLDKQLDFSWYVRRGKVVDLAAFCRGRTKLNMHQLRQSGYYQGAAVKLTADAGRDARLIRFEELATDLAKARKTGQALSPTYAG